MELNCISIGADPELFIIDTNNNNKVISAVGIIPGVKGAPYAIEELGKGYGIEIDNILAEYNIPPAYNKEQFVQSVKNMLGYLRNYVKNINKNYDIQCIASRLVEDDQLQSPEAKLFGCSVDYNAYSCEANPKPEGTSTNLRSAGFHLHIGYENPNIATSLALIRALDITLGIPSLLFDNDNKRRLLYGKAGCFRLTSYGVEYRTLSSKMHDHLEFLYNGIWDAIRYVNNEECDSAEMIQSIINNNVTNAAIDFIKENKSLYKHNIGILGRKLLSLTTEEDKEKCVGYSEL